ncbi:MAG: DUF2752 domain-containing protein [bacterium]|nr:DUF2752 domain-containing protein [bacterium]
MKHNSRSVYFGLIFLGLLALPLIYLVIKDYLFLPSCTFKNLTGLPCPGCGIRTGIDLLCEFRFRETFFAYPPLLACGLLYLSWPVYFLRKTFSSSGSISRSAIKYFFASLILIHLFLFGSWIIKLFEQ